MTLGKGDKIIKVNKETGEPLKNESHVEYEIINNSPYTEQGLLDTEQTRIVVLKLLR